jgi:peptide/nickel transport system permease protein
MLQMLSHIVRKLIGVIPILLLVSMILFTIISLLPGDAAMAVMGESLNQEDLIKTRSELGLDKPIYVRYADWLCKVLHGNLGRALKSNQPVTEIIKQRLPVTVELTLLAVVISTLIALPAGIFSALRRNSTWDVVDGIISMIGIAMPPFWMGILLILFFSVWCGWLPSSGYISFFKDPLKNLQHMAMPAFTIGFAFAATIMRQTRSSMLEVLGEEYIETARAKGLKESVVIWKHALRNALIPVVTVISMQMGRLIGGAVVTETVFALPGVGRQMIDSIIARDYPVVMALILITALCVVLTNALVDIIYVVIDPRISHAKES